MMPALLRALNVICLLLGLLALSGIAMPQRSGEDGIGKTRLAWIAADDRGASETVLPQDADPPAVIAALRAAPSAEGTTAAAFADPAAPMRDRAHGWPESRAPPRAS